MRIMSFNLKFAMNEPPNLWEPRRPVTKKIIHSTAPDLIGTQEGLYSQLCDIQTDCPEYGWIGLGREGGSHGEFCAIFYHRNRLKPLEFDHFWLSDTPNTIGSITWGHHCVRMATWVRFLDLNANSQFYLFNTHLDNESQMAREKGSRLILRRMESDLDSRLPIILTGDFNAEARANPTYDIFINEGGFADMWYSADRHEGTDYSTFHGYNAPVPDGPHIDWILARGGVKSLSSSVIDISIDGQYASDHFPITCDMILPVSH